ncbi:hypothetical protein LJR225_004822 [Phenylobacterium sp. LjRoot225]|uniref:hypothetical protein n=1 Tax=Phenylobacterium sp. LjRoot225 TaxID=3342285 RepID=UPI003ECCA540
METPTPVASDASPENWAVGVDGSCVTLGTPGGVARLEPAAAARLAEQLWDAAREAGGETPRGGPPFPPAELVSPHGAG